MGSTICDDPEEGGFKCDDTIDRAYSVLVLLKEFWGIQNVVGAIMESTDEVDDLDFDLDDDDDETVVLLLLEGLV
jgi:hypothetical protein